MNAKQAIYKAYKGQKNFITPTVIRYGWIEKNKTAYEFSCGEDMDHKLIYGVSVVDIDKSGNVKQNIALSQAIPNKQAAERYIYLLKEKRKDAH